MRNTERTSKLQSQQLIGINELAIAILFLSEKVLSVRDTSVSYEWGFRGELLVLTLQNTGVISKIQGKGGDGEWLSLSHSAHWSETEKAIRFLNKQTCWECCNFHNHLAKVQAKDSWTVSTANFSVSMIIVFYLLLLSIFL